MRIGIDGYNLAMARGAGVARYALELAKTIKSMGHEVDGVFGLRLPDDPSLREAALFDSLKGGEGPTGKLTRVRRMKRLFAALRRPRPIAVPISDQVEKLAFAHRIPPFDRLTSVPRLFERSMVRFKATGRFTRLHLSDPPDIMHWTYPLPIVVHGARNIYTLHDLVPLKLPYTTLDDKALYGRLVAQCVERADQICTVSEASRRDITARYAIDPARITNTYQTTMWSSNLPVDAAADARAIDGIFGLSWRGYFLYFGAIEPKKNVGRLIEAYLSLQSATPLVIVGARAWQADQELRLMPGDGASGAAGTYRGHRGQTIVRLDYLSRELLAKLIGGARAVVFPSLYEGFGLPVLEAMQAGTPVITSNTSSLPEIAGDACLLIDPYDVAELQAAMRRVDADEALCRTMAARGLEQAKLFSRERYQDRLTELYRAAMTPR